MTPATQEPRLSLFQIDQGLYDLLIYREDIKSDPKMEEGDRKATLEQIDRSMGEYMARLRDKVDGIAWVKRELTMRPEVYRAEAARLLDEARKMESGLKCLEGLVIGVMQHMGGKPIKGKAATLCLQNNPPSVDVRQPEMVPDEYKRARIAMPFSLYKMLMGALGTLEGKFAQALYRQLLDCRVEPEIMRSLALPVLKQQGPCPECNGSGQRLDRVAEDFAPDCPTCKGTGKVYIGAVAGLALVTDQVHLRIK